MSKATVAQTGLAPIVNTNTIARPKPPFPHMSWIPGRTFLMGSDRHSPEEAPARAVNVGGFWMDQHTVTNAQFARFVDHTNYVTAAEREPPLIDKHPHERVVSASMVFRKGPSAAGEWDHLPGANWRHPLGPSTSLRGLAKHPVVHIAFEDARAYVQWASKELPTEAEWELAARGGLEGAEFVWGNEFAPGDQLMANTRHDDFANGQLGSHTNKGTATVGSFAANGYGLFDMAGNVWEWTADPYDSSISRSCCNYEAGKHASGEEDVSRRNVALLRIIKGGSFLCTASCDCYRPAARMAQPDNLSAFHLGFRCVVRP